MVFGSCLKVSFGSLVRENFTNNTDDTNNDDDATDEQNDIAPAPGLENTPDYGSPL